MPERHSHLQQQQSEVKQTLKYQTLQQTNESEPSSRQIHTDRSLTINDEVGYSH